MRVALPKGRLLNEVLLLLDEVDVNFTLSNDRNYSPTCNDPNIKAKLVKAKAIPQLVALGNFDVGFCGLDLVEENNYENVLAIHNTGLNCVTLIAAGKEGFLKNLPKRPVVIATEYERIASKWAMKHGLSHVIVQTYGSTEAYVPEDADIIVDNCATGNTLKANGLSVFETIMSSATYLVANKTAYEKPEMKKAIDNLVAKLVTVKVSA